MSNLGRARALGAALCSLLASCPWAPTPVAASELTAADAQKIIEIYGNDAIASGYAVGVGIGVISGDHVVASRGFGWADVANSFAFKTDTVFAIASNTKVFTTNLLGQNIVEHTLERGTALGALSTVVGTMAGAGGKVTLQELADFTAGYPDYAPLCSADEVYGCMPNSRPNLQAYTPRNLLSFFQHYDLPNRLPAEYLYSDISTGFLGLILGGPTEPITDNAVNSWWRHISNEILTPLGMASTFLFLPDNIPERRFAAGYAPAAATVSVDPATGRISSTIDVVTSGAGYDASAPPAVAILGGGGENAAAVAHVSGGGVASITLKPNGAGSGYIAPPTVQLIRKGGSGAKAAEVRAIVKGGQIVAFYVTKGGSGYTNPPLVVISGGRGAGRDASATAHVANGAVTAVTVDDGGAGYVDPLRIVIAPGARVADVLTNVIPAWAPAGGMSSTIDDMNRFIAAAAGVSNIQGVTAPTALIEGFREAERGDACLAQSAGECWMWSAFAWDVTRADDRLGQNYPQIVSKNGGLNGFSSQIVLAPGLKLGVVVMVNARATDPNNPNHAPAAIIARQVMNALIYRQ